MFLILVICLFAYSKCDLIPEIRNDRLTIHTRHKYQNCIHLADRECQRCDDKFILIEGICEPRVSPDEVVPLCIKKTKLGDCAVCECGLSFDEELNTCIPTPSTIPGCQVFRAQNESVCLRPKEEFEILTKNDGTFISIQFGYYSRCEIRSAETKFCKRCHSGYHLNELRTSCIQSKIFPFEYMYHSFFDSDQKLVSRDIRLTALPTGLYRIIENCQNYSLNTELLPHHIVCEECSIHTIPNQSRTLCVKKPFSSCGMVSDEDFRICKQCLFINSFYLFENSRCLPRTPSRFDRCLEFSKFSDSCLKCKPPFTLYSSFCVIPSQIPQTLETQQNHSKIMNCHYQITRNFCLECEIGFTLDKLGTCKESISYDPFCELLNLNGTCAQCKQGYQLKQNSSKCQSDLHESCAWPTVLNQIENPNVNKSICKECMSGYSLFENSICLILIQQCHFTFNKQHQFSDSLKTFSEKQCLKCNNLFYISPNMQDEQFDLCHPILSYRFCIISDGIHDSCLICHRQFERTPDGRCESRIRHKHGRCESEFAFIRNESDPYCVPHDFIRFEVCMEFHPTLNRCLKCLPGNYIDIVSGHCEYMQMCEFSSGVDRICFTSFYDNVYIDLDDKFTVKSYQKYAEKTCQTNKRDPFCIECVDDKGEIGRISILDSSCISPSSILNQSFPNCIAVSPLPEHLQDMLSSNSTTGFWCALCKNLYYLTADGTCQQIEQFDRCQISDGKEDICLFCGKYHTGEYFIAYIQENNSKKCLKRNEGSFPVLNCEVYKEGVCVKCENLYFIDSIQFNPKCSPIKSPFCTRSNGITDSCEECKNNPEISTPEFLKLNCIHEYCEEIDSATNLCKTCIPGFHLTQNQLEGIAIRCLPNADINCMQRSLIQQDCLKCRVGYYLRPFESTIECYKILQPNCLEMADNLLEECIACEPGYFLTKQQNNCVPINDRCQEFDEESLECLKCHEQFFLSNNEEEDGIYQKATCELHDSNCEEFSTEELHQGIPPCVRCKSGYFISHDTVSNTSECKRIDNCEYSYGIHEMCIRCQPKYLNKSFHCFLQNPIEFCVDYQDDTFNLCRKCQSLYYLSKDSKECLRTNIYYCRESLGVTNSCSLCEIHGLMLTGDFEDPRSSNCIPIQNCRLSDGISNCFECEEGFYVKDRDIITQNIEVQQNKQSVCLKQTTIENCYQYSNDSPSCAKCQNLFYLSKDKRTCLKLSTNPKQNQNCLVSNGVSDDCEQCVDNYLLYFIEITNRFECILSSMHPFPECQIFSQSKSQCYQCFPGYYLRYNREVSNSMIKQSQSCVLRKELSEFNSSQTCAHYHADSDSCKICKSGFRLVQEDSKHLTKKICEPIIQTQKVNNCEIYEPNSTLCSKCKQKIERIQYWLDMQRNKCENVEEIMCRTMKNTSWMSCKEKYIYGCIQYEEDEENLSIQKKNWNCILCQNGFYLKDYHCLEHRINIPFCEEYHQNFENACAKCSDGYSLESDFKICYKNALENCISHLENSNPLRCFECESMYSVDYTSGKCLRSNMNDCRVIQNSEHMDGSTTLDCVYCKNDLHYWTLSTQKCEYFPYLGTSCASFSEQTCLSCQLGYIMIQSIGCISKNYSRCLTYNCEKYSNKSKGDLLLCETCKIGDVECKQAIQAQSERINNDQTDKDGTCDDASRDSSLTNDLSDGCDKGVTFAVIILIVISLLIGIAIIAGVIIYCFRNHRISRNKNQLDTTDPNNTDFNASQNDTNSIEITATV